MGQRQAALDGLAAHCSHQRADSRPGLPIVLWLVESGATEGEGEDGGRGDEMGEAEGEGGNGGGRER